MPGLGTQTALQRAITRGHESPRRCRPGCVAHGKPTRWQAVLARAKGGGRCGMG